MPLSEKEDRIFELLTKKQTSGKSLPGKEGRILELLSKKSGLPADSRSFVDKALEVAGGVAAGITNITGGAGKVGQIIADTGALGAIPVTDKEAFKDTPLLETAGGMAGGVGGFAVGGIPGAIVGGGVGSGLGRAADEGIRELVGVGDVEGAGDLAKRVGISAGIGAAGEGVGGLGVKIAGKVLAPFKKKVLPEAERAIKFFKDKTDQLFLPAEATEDRALDLIENVAEASIFGGGSIKKFKLNREAFLNGYLDDFANQFGKEATPADLGNTVVNIINDRISIFDDLAKPFYNTAEELTKGLTVTKRIGPGRLTSQALRRPGKVNVGIVDMRGVKNTLAGSKAIASELNNIGSEVTGSGLSNQILGLEDNISFAAAKDLRSTLIKLSDQFKIERKNAPAVAAMNRIAGRIDEAVTAALTKHSPEALTAWREGNRIIKQKSKELQNKFLRRLVKMADPSFGNNPEGLVNAVFKKGSISNVENLKKAVDDKTWTKVKGWLTRDLIAKSTNRDGTLVGKNLKEAMFGRSGLGKEAMGSVFTKEQINILENTINAIAISQSKQGENTGKMLIQLSQGGGLVLLATGNVQGAAPILVGPVVAGKLLTNKTIGKLLTQGFRAPAGSRGFISIFSKLTAAIANLEREENKKNKDTNRRTNRN